MKDVVSMFPTLFGVSNLVNIIFLFAILWVFGRMGDNINKIRKMLEDELKKKDISS